jgi:hypothetical protein
VISSKLGSLRGSTWHSPIHKLDKGDMVSIGRGRLPPNVHGPGPRRLLPVLAGSGLAPNKKPRETGAVVVNGQSVKKTRRRPLFDEVYWGYGIVIEQVGRSLYAFVWRPGARLEWGPPAVTASADEGRTTLLERAKARIDEDREKRINRPARERMPWQGW